MILKSLSEITKQNRGKGNSGSVPYIEIGDININTKEYSYKDKPSIAGCLMARKGNILISRVRPTRGAISLVREDKICVSSAFTILEPNENILLNKYLFYSLAYNKIFYNYLGKMQKGTSYPSCKEKDLLNFQINLSFLPEQKRIVEILEKADNLRKKRQEADELMKKTLMSFALNIFGDPSKNIKKWETKKFNEIAVLQRGRFGHRPRNEPRFYGGKYPFIQINDITKSGMIITEYSQTLNEKGLAISKIFPSNTVVVSIASTIGEVGILGFDSCFPDSLVGITPKKGIVAKEYIYFYLNYMKSHLNKIAPQLAQKNINLKILNNLDVPVPVFPEQQKFAYLVQQVEKIKEKQQESKKDLDSLFNSLMHRVFKDNFHADN